MRRANRPGAGGGVRGVLLLTLVLALALSAACGGRSAVRPDRPVASGRTAASEVPFRPPSASARGGVPSREQPEPRPPPPPPGLLAALPGPTRASLVARAARWLGHRGPFVAGGRRFHPDCSGFVEAVYESAGIPVRDAITIRPQDEQRASAALQRAARELGVLYGAEREPLPGDLVFFEDTYQRARHSANGVTHVGLVEAVLPDGTVRFLHRGGRGVARASLRLATPDRAWGPDGEQWNSALRAARRGDPREIRTLAGELFAGFGRIDPARVASVLDGNPRLDLAALGYGEPRAAIELPAGR